MPLLHLDTDTLELYIFNRIPEPELASVEEHLLMCTVCQDACETLQLEIDRIRDARPTAVNLAWGVSQVRPWISHGTAEVLRRARQVVADDEAANRELSRRGADWVLARVAKDTVRVVTHCNTGALATCGWGTAYGIIHELHERGRLGLVYADETRPLLQGARLTSWELLHDGIEHVLQADSAAASTIIRGLVDVAIIGADRIAANGDTANKVGSVGLALACQRAGIPFVVAAPSSTVDLAVPSGQDIVIEQRGEDEVLGFAGARTSPAGVRGFNPAFDVTPHDLISAVVTERGIVEASAFNDPDLRGIGPHPAGYPSSARWPRSSATSTTTSLRRRNQGLKGGSKRARRGVPTALRPSASMAWSRLSRWRS